jgi:hypothetical protein
MLSFACLHRVNSSDILSLLETNEGTLHHECWSNLASADNTTEIFICPSQSEPVAVLAILLHELVHAAVGLECGHKGAFKRVALALGLEGKMTATYPGVKLASDLPSLPAH